MKLDKKDNSMLFKNTEIPDIFFTEYMSHLSGDTIKVYLCLVFLSKYNTDIKLNDLSKKLNLPLQSIQSALSSLEHDGLITKNPEGFILNNIQEIELNKLYSPNLTLTPDTIAKNEDSKYRARAIESINNICFQGIMSPSWYSDIDLWFKKYNFDEQVMISLFEHCLNKSALHKNYVQAVAENWFKNNIKTYSDLENYFTKYEKTNKIKKTIAKKLGRYNSLTQFEEAYIEKWLIDYNYNLDIINIALKKTTSKANASFDYIDKLLSDWHDRNLNSVESIESFLLEFKSKNKTSKTTSKATNYNNYEQRQYDNLDDFYANNKIS